ncbi:MAG: amidohydrolase family protein [Rhodobacteraceae bacterium]|nr:amidohydrolase family protein [Paracoccaceae bacterium]
MRIDAHHHLWDLNKVDYPWLMESGKERFFGNPEPIQRNFLIEEFRAKANNEGFEGSVHVQVGAADGLEEARWIQEVAYSNPDWNLVQVAFCDLTSSTRESVLEEYSDLSTVVGIRQIVGRSDEEDRLSGTNNLLYDSEFSRGLETIAKLGFSFDLQLTPPLMAAAASIFSRIPELNVILCHAGSPKAARGEEFKIWKEGISELATLPNMSCKISGLPMFFRENDTGVYQPIIDTCLQSFGATRCIFGSNFPVDSLYKNYGTLVDGYEACIPEELHSRIFGRNAWNTYFSARRKL